MKNAKLFLKILITALVFCAGKGMAAKSEIKTDYLAEYNRITKPVGFNPDKNAGSLYQKAFDAYIDLPDLLKNKKVYMPLEDFSAEEIKCLRNWLDSNAECIGYFQQAAVKSYWWIERQADNNALNEIVFPEMIPFRNAANAVAWELKLKAYDGQYKDAFKSLFDIYFSSTQLMSPKIYVEQLVGLAVRSLATRTAFSILGEQIDPILLESFKEKFGSYIQDFKIGIEYSQGELLYFLDSIQRTFTDDGNGDGRLIPSAFADMTKNTKALDGSSLRVSYLKAFLIGLTHPGRKDTVELAERRRDYFNRLIEKTPWQLHKENTTYTKNLVEYAKGNYFLNFSSKAEGFVCEIKHRAQAFEEALICTIAIMEYKNQRKEFPEKLEDLIANGNLDNLPIDPYSGKPLVYKKTENDFILYSIGADFKDDGGMPSIWGTDREGGDQVFWPIQG